MDAKSIKVGGVYKTTHGDAKVIEALGEGVFSVQRVGKPGELSRRLRAEEFTSVISEPAAPAKKPKDPPPGKDAKDKAGDKDPDDSEE